MKGFIQVKIKLLRSAHKLMSLLFHKNALPSVFKV